MKESEQLQATRDIPVEMRVQDNEALRELIGEYLRTKGHDLGELEEIAEGLPSMSRNTVGVVVACAFNERALVGKFIESVASQIFSKQSGLSPREFEVLVIPNNCSDDTTEVALHFRNKLCPSIPTFIVEKNFPPQKASLGSARKFGFDLALYRFLHKPGLDSELYLISLDTDSPIPANHLEKVVTTFRVTGADALSGDADLLSVRDYLSEETPNMQALYQLYVDSIRIQHTKSRNLNTSGGNSAVTAFMYALVGGIENVPIEDTSFCKKLRKVEAEILRLPSAIHQNPRRVLIDPLSYVTPDPIGEYVLAYRPEIFAKTNPRSLPTPLPDITSAQSQEIIHQFSKLLSRWEASATGTSPDILYEARLRNIWRIIKQREISIKI